MDFWTLFWPFFNPFLPFLPEDDAEQDGGDDEAWMIHVILRQDAHPQEEEDDTVAGGGQRLDWVLDSCETLLADVLESVMLRCHSKADDADDPRPGQKCLQMEIHINILACSPHF